MGGNNKNNRTVGAFEISAAVLGYLDEYNAQIQEATNTIAVDVAKQSAKTLRRQSPKRTGAYARSWSVKIVRSGVTASTQAIVHAKAPHYRLAHLLEHGHKGPYGKGRPTPAHEHIGKVERAGIAEFERRVKEAIANGR